MQTRNIKTSPFPLRCGRSLCLSACIVAALATGGCSLFSGGAAGPYRESIPADAMKRPLDLSEVCILDNPAVKVEGVLFSLEEGVRRFGASPRVVPQEAGPQACSMVIHYGIRTRQGKIVTVYYQTFENSIPIMQAHGSATKARSLSFDAIANFTVQLLRRTKERRNLGIVGGHIDFDKT